MIRRAIYLANHPWLIIPLLIGCGTTPVRPPEPVIITRDVPTIVQVKCQDMRPPLPDFPDDDADLAAVSLGDPLAVFLLAQIYAAARPLYRQRLREDDAQIEACSGE